MHETSNVLFIFMFLLRMFSIINVISMHLTAYFLKMCAVAPPALLSILFFPLSSLLLLSFCLATILPLNSGNFHYTPPEPPMAVQRRGSGTL